MIRCRIRTGGVVGLTTPGKPYLQSVKLHHGLERDEEKQLLVGVALHPVLGRGLAAIAEAGRLVALEEDAHTTGGLCVDIQELTSVQFDLTCEVSVASGDDGTTPGSAFAVACAAGAFAGRIFTLGLGL